MLNRKQLVIIAIVASGLTAGGALLAQKVPEFFGPKVPQEGNFEIVGWPGEAWRVYLLEKKTGRVWELTELPKSMNSPRAWVPMDRLDTMAQVLQWYALQEKLHSSEVRLPPTGEKRSQTKGASSSAGSGQR